VHAVWFIFLLEALVEVYRVAVDPLASVIILICPVGEDFLRVLPVVSATVEDIWAPAELCVFSTRLLLN
jgi:hypothetical protein